MPVARTKVRQGAHLKVWRQKSGTSPGSFRDYDAKDIPSEASFLEMLDIVNESLTESRMNRDYAAAAVKNSLSV